MDVIPCLTTLDFRQWWEDATLARRRTVLEELMVVTIHPIGKGKRVTTIAAAAETVGITWRRTADGDE